MCSATSEGFDSVSGGTRGRVWGTEGGWRKTDIRSTTAFDGDLEGPGMGDDALSDVAFAVTSSRERPSLRPDVDTGVLSQSSKPGRLRFFPRSLPEHSVDELRSRAAPWTSPFDSTSASRIRLAGGAGDGSRLDTRASRVSVSSFASMQDDELGIWPYQFVPLVFPSLTGYR